MVLTVIAVAFASAAPSLGVAEFAPAARSALDTPPSTAGGGSGAGGTAGRRSTTTTAPQSSGTSSDKGAGERPATSLASRTRACVGSPPRQTEDPMSPPCIATIFEGDNGGATSRGVSGTEIRVGVQVDGGFTTDGGMKSRRDTILAMFEHFNRRFELYGRRMVPVFVEGFASDAVTSRAVGATIAAEDVFSATTARGEYHGGAQMGVVQELARNKVVTTVRNAGPWWSDRSLFDQYHPYVWSVYPSAETNMINFADFSCTSLVGRPASHAHDPAMQDKTRKFGVVAVGTLAAPPTRLVTERLAACGETAVTVQWTNSSGSSSTAIERLRAAGVTTAICVCEEFGAWSAISASVGAGYQPEWMFGANTNFSDEYTGQQSYYRAGFIRLSAEPRLLPLAVRPWFQAILETNPTLLTSGMGTLQPAFTIALAVYEPLLIMASGIQAAGPNLTPETFASGLMGMQFPNPGAGQAPYWQPTAGFGAGDHSFYDDYAISWWSDTAPAVEPYSPKALGSWCYVGQGARYAVGTYPPDADSHLYNDAEPCR